MPGFFDVYIRNAEAKWNSTGGRVELVSTLFQRMQTWSLPVDGRCFAFKEDRNSALPLLFQRPFRNDDEVHIWAAGNWLLLFSNPNPCLAYTTGTDISARELKRTSIPYGAGSSGWRRDAQNQANYKCLTNVAVRAAPQDPANAVRIHHGRVPLACRAHERVRKRVCQTSREMQREAGPAYGKLQRGSRPSRRQPQGEPSLSQLR